jgi:hypothetical protein
MQGRGDMSGTRSKLSFALSILLVIGCNSKINVAVKNGAAKRCATAATNIDCNLTDSTEDFGVTLSTTDASPFNKAEFSVTVTADQEIEALTAANFSIENGTIATVNGSGKSYILKIKASTSTSTSTSTSGTLSLSIPEAVVFAKSGSKNKASNKLTLTIDLSAPQVTLSSSATTSVSAPFLVTASFSEIVTGFEASDLSLTNGTVTGFSGSGSEYTFTVVPSAPGSVTVSVPENVAIDNAKNGNQASATLSRTSVALAPTVTMNALTSPTQIGTNLTVGWNIASSLSSLTVTIKDLANATASCSTGTTVAQSTGVTSGSSSIAVDTTSLSGGAHYFCILVNDGVNDVVASSTSSVVVLYASTTCTWTGTTSTAWSTAGNWSGCSGSAPTSASNVLIPSGLTNMPTLSSSTTINSFATGLGGGTLTVAAGATLTLATGTNTIRSSVKFVGSTTTCSTCWLSGSTNITITDGAVVTLGSGMKMNPGSIAQIFVGSSTTYGSLIVDTSSGISGERPSLGGLTTWHGIVVQGVDANHRSKLSLNGANFGNLNGNGINAIEFKSYSEVGQMDSVYFAYDQVTNGNNLTNIAIVKFTDCTGSVISDATWSSLNFPTYPTRQNWNVYLSGTACNSMSPVTITGSGIGYGAGMASDSNNLLTWTNGAVFTCQWIGGTSGSETSWTTPANWQNCTNNRGNYPDGNDWVVVPAAATYQPALPAGNYYIRGFGLDTVNGGGIVTIGAGATLYIHKSSVGTYGSFNSDITVKGVSPTCTTCILQIPQNLTILNGAKLTLGTGLQVKLYGNASYSIVVGNGTSSGQLKAANAGASTSEWPTIGGGALNAGMTVAGISSSKSVLDIDGLNFTNTYIYAGSQTAVTFNNYYTITKLNNFSITSHGNANVPGKYFKFNNCANGTFSALTWDGLRFISPITTGYNIDFSSCNLASIGGTAISVINASGSGAGQTYENDPNGVINDW